jgi:exopolysaccharide biosynthesis WecB/TagA/CpsF family protein
VQAQDVAHTIVYGDAAQLRRAAGACDAVAWDAMISSLSPQTLPYIEYRLRHADAFAAAPHHVQQTLLRARDVAVAASLMRRNALQSATRYLAAAGISPVLLKGAALATTLYPRFYLRPMSDIDLWIEPAVLPQAVRCLLAHGFTPSPDSAADGRVHPDLSQHRLVAARTGIRVELHGDVHSLDGLSASRIDACWRHASAPPELDGNARVLSAGDALLHTCLHLARHGFAESQVGLLDVALLTHDPRHQFDWTTIARDALGERVAVSVTLALRVAQDVWGARIPSEYFAAIGTIRDLDEMRAYALSQVWAQRTRLPAALDAAFQAQSGPAALATFRRHIVRSKPAGVGSDARASSLSATTAYVKDKASRYLRAWATGELKPRELRRRARLAADRGHLKALVETAEHRLASPWPRKADVMGVNVSVTTYAELTDCIATAARERRSGCVTALAVHGLVTAHDDGAFHAVLDTFEAVAPDGQPVRIALNVLRGARLTDRVRGVDLTVALCERAERDGLTVFLLGSRPAVVGALKTGLQARFPHLAIVGSEPGVYGVLDSATDAALIARINDSGAHLLLVGMGCLHQERFVFAHRDSIRALQVCVGSAFDIVGRTQPNAPAWMQRLALEWLFRLVHEPRRLWRRYLFTNSRFLVLFARELTRRVSGR